MHIPTGATPEILEHIRTKIPNMIKCIENYINKFSTLNNNTAVVIVRTVENQIIKEQNLPATRTVHNKIRTIILNLIEQEYSNA